MSLSKDGFDAIVVGAGPAGAVCAARLSASGRNTLLLEAGPSDDDPSARYGLVQPEENSPWYWPPVEERVGNPTDVQGALSTKYATDYWSGRGIGGGSAVNGMVLSTGSAADYDRWVEHHGCIGWRGQDMKPWLKKAIDVLQPEPAAVANGDPAATAIVTAFEGAAGAAEEQFGDGGSTLDPDARGVLVPMLSTRQGRRRTVPAAYFAGSGKREPHDWRQHPRRPCLVVEGSSKRCCIAGRSSNFGAARRRRRRSNRFTPVAPPLRTAQRRRNSSQKPPVGGREPSIGPGPITFPLMPRQPLVFFALRWEVDSGSMGKGAGVHRGGRVVEIHLVGPFGARSNATGALLAILQEPSSVGCLEDVSSDRPRLMTNRLGVVGDRSTFRSVLRALGELSARLTSTLGVQPASVGAVEPLTAVELADLDDQRLDRWMVANQGPVYHAVATCRMGSQAEDGSCTESSPDCAGAVRGVDGLVVADASIFPDLVCGGLQLAVTAVAERVSAGLIAVTGSQ